MTVKMWGTTVFAFCTAIACDGRTVPTFAANDGKVWQFRQAQGSAGVGRKSAGLTFGVPETDDVQAQGGCDSRVGRGTPKISLTLATDIGTLEEDARVTVRFTGGEFKHTVKAAVHGTKIEEGVTGVLLQLSHSDPLWQAMQERDALDYQIPGYQISNLKLRGGASTIQRFVDTCRRYAGNASQRTTQKNSKQNKARLIKTGGAIDEKEAFESAKELGTIEGWEAFLNSFPSGFRADLARAYVKRLADGGARSSGGASTKSKSSTSGRSKRKVPILDTFESRPGLAPWRTTRYEMDEGNASARAAAVKGNGVELLFHCDGNKRLAGILREVGRGLYPNFDRRMQQGLDAKRSGSTDQGPVSIPMLISNGRTYSIGAQVMELNGEVSLSRRADDGGFKADGPMIADLMSEDTVTISAPP
ncbi:MAG: hypothetical protein K0U34_08805, partial [Alphaproteobacteria bacterium]|nr:hypothetical protein [Alphaproteobacteria bacterium]